MLFKVFLRSFFIQAVWNFEQLQNIGFAFGILPVLRKLYPDKGARAEVLQRHLNFFNTHPYMVNIIFGLVASLEEELKEGKPIKPEIIDALKNNMAGPLAAIGDTFFWATWRPFVAVVAASLIVFFNKSGDFAGTWLAPLFFLMVYNLLHVSFRYWSLRMGYQLKTKVVEIITEFEFQYVTELVRIAGVMMVGFIVLYYFLVYCDTFSQQMCALIIFLAGVIFGFMRLSPSLLYYTALLIIFIYVSFVRI
jgi:mannose/fructose/N-acetylgalactosamine-specific phosphotransferase system component IID